MNANPGDLVECINDKPSAGMASWTKMPFTKGRIYKVEKLGQTVGNKRPAYKLEGIRYFWTRTRFRKVDGDKQAFKDLLSKHAPKKVTEDV